MISLQKSTGENFDAVIAVCKTLFLKKAADYGASWRVMRMPSITDQLYIKALRIRTLEESPVHMVAEGIDQEFMGLANYSIIAWIQEYLQLHPETEMGLHQMDVLFDQAVSENRALMVAKNHDYGEAWKQIRVSSITDLILTKILRIKQIEDHGGSTLVSEGVKSNYQDILNYAVFALIRLADNQP